MDETVLAFGRWRLLPRSRRLLADDAPVPLGSRAFDLLLALVEARGALMTKDELLRRVWPGTVVEENNLQVQVAVLRKVFGEDAPGLIGTVPGRGYRFTGVVSDASPAAAEPDASPVAASPLGSIRLETTPPSPSSGPPMVVVLPFANMSGDPEQEYFADGITEDLTTALSRVRWFSVIARNSAFTYKGRAVDVRQVGRELGVGYVLEGSVRKVGGQVRISAQLCEAGSGGHVWAERFDGELADIFDLQDRVAGAVAGAIEPNLRLAEVERIRAKPTESLGAYDLYLRALPQRWATHDGNDEALRLLRRAVALDPGFATAKGTLASLHTVRFAQGWAGEGDVAEAVRLAREVVEGGDAGGDPAALSGAAMALAYLARDHEAGLAAVERALALGPDSAMALIHSGWIHAYAGDAATAVAHLERAIRLSPLDPAMFSLAAALSLAHLVGGRYQESVGCARRALRDRPAYLSAHRLLAAGLALLGRSEEAKEAVCTLLSYVPGYTVAAAAEHSALRHPALRERYLDALRKAGLPE